MPLDLAVCPVCGSAIPYNGHAIAAHMSWHEQTLTLTGWTADDATARTHTRPTWAPADDTPTAKLPPIGETVRRRPPVPDVRELKGAELLEALAASMRADELDDEEL